MPTLLFWKIAQKSTEIGLGNPNRIGTTSEGTK